MKNKVIRCEFLNHGKYRVFLECGCVFVACKVPSYDMPCPKAHAPKHSLTYGTLDHRKEI